MFHKNGTYIAEFGKEHSPNSYWYNFGPMLNQLNRYSMEHPRAIAIDEQADRLYISESGHPRYLKLPFLFTSNKSDNRFLLIRD